MVFSPFMFGLSYDKSDDFSLAIVKFTYNILIASTILRYNPSMHFSSGVYLIEICCCQGRYETEKSKRLSQYHRFEIFWT